MRADQGGGKAESVRTPPFPVFLRFSSLALLLHLFYELTSWSGMRVDGLSKRWKRDSSLPLPLPLAVASTNPTPPLTLPLLLHRPRPRRPPPCIPSLLLSLLTWLADCLPCLSTCAISSSHPLARLRPFLVCNFAHHPDAFVLPPPAFPPRLVLLVSSLAGDQGRQTPHPLRPKPSSLKESTDLFASAHLLDAFLAETHRLPFAARATHFSSAETQKGSETALEIR